jgi:hypothetical protein
MEPEYSQYIKDHNVKVLSSPIQINRDSKIEFECITDKCVNTHIKSVRQIIKVSGAFCKSCTQNNKAAKTKQTAIEKYGVTNHANQPEILKKKNEAKIRF